MGLETIIVDRGWDAALRFILKVLEPKLRARRGRDPKYEKGGWVSLARRRAGS